MPNDETLRRKNGLLGELYEETPVLETVRFLVTISPTSADAAGRLPDGDAAQLGLPAELKMAQIFDSGTPFLPLARVTFCGADFACWIRSPNTLLDDVRFSSA